MRDSEGAFSRRAVLGHDRCHFQRTVSQPHTIASVSCIKPEGYPGGVHLPEGERGSSSLDPHAYGSLLPMKHRVPGQDAFRLQWPPLEITIASLPGVAESEHAARK